MIGKEHKNILRDVRGYSEELGKLKIEPTDFFTESTYQSEQGKELPCYLVTKKGCEFIGNKLIGIKGTEFTAKYINRFHSMEDIIQNNLLDGLSTEMKALIMQDKKLQAVVDHITQTDSRVESLENNMTIDYGQQLVIREKVNSIVIHWLGGKDSNAYHEIAKKVFSECNHDIQNYFSVNSRNNLPKIKFDDAVYYIGHWEPCTNTKLEIMNCNAQMNL